MTAMTQPTHNPIFIPPADPAATGTPTTASEMKDAALGKAEELKSAAGRKMEVGRNQVDVAARDLRARCERETRERPTRILPIAFGLGMAIGYLIRRV
jgi:hypothetical protein